MRSLILALLALVFLPATAAERIVSLGGSVTETIFALGAGELVIARDASSLVPDAVNRLPDVGYFRTIGAEGVLAQKPTLIFAAQGTGPENQVTILKNSGIRFVHLEAKPSAASTFEMFRQVGEAVGRAKEAATLATRIQSRFDAAAALAKRSPTPPKVVVLMGAGSGVYQAAFDDTAGDALVTLAGGVNPFRGIPGYKPVSAEELIAADPDFIFIGSRTGPARDAELAEPASVPDSLRGTRAARTGRLHQMDMAYYLVFGPRIGDAVVAFARAIHPAAP
jgi:iron complex transport system substrate-binding protein